MRAKKKGSEAKRPTADSLSGSIVQFLKNLEPDPILPHLFQSGVIDLDQYQLFRKRAKRKLRPKVVNKLVKHILKNDAPGNEYIQKFHKALLEEGFTELADILCTPCSAAEPKEAKRPRKWTKVKLEDLRKKPRFEVSVMVQIVHQRSRTNTTAEFIVGENDDAKILLVYLQSFDLQLQQYDIGSNLLLCGAAWVAGHVVVSSRNVSRSAPVTVSEEGRSQAELLHSQPKPEPAPSGTPLNKVLEAPKSTCLSTTVTIDSVEQTKMVKKKPETVPRKDFRIRDASGEMPAQLWRDMAATKIAPGQRWCLFGKVMENKQGKVFSVIQADCVDGTTSAPDRNWLSSNDHQEGELQSVEVTHYYHCSKERCSNKKLIAEKPCNTCGKISPMKSLYAKMKLQLEEEIVELTAFSPELSQLYALLGLDFDESLPDSDLEDQIFQKMPGLVCGVKIEGDVVTNFRMK